LTRKKRFLPKGLVGGSARELLALVWWGILVDVLFESDHLDEFRQVSEAWWEARWGSEPVPPHIEVPELGEQLSYTVRKSIELGTNLQDAYFPQQAQRR